MAWGLGRHILTNITLAIMDYLKELPLPCTKIISAHRKTEATMTAIMYPSEEKALSSIPVYSTVTDFARFLGLSTSRPFWTAMK